jgi:hypothetical protein
MDESKELHELCRVYHDANYNVLKVYLEEHPEVKVDLYKDWAGWTAIHITSRRRSPRSTELLLDYKAGINARTLYDRTPLIVSCLNVWNEDTALLLIERGADIYLKDYWNFNVLHFCLREKNLSIAFTLLCCGSDSKNVKITSHVTQAKLDACIAEYKQTHAFIESYHDSLRHTLTKDVRVDTRLAGITLGIYHEPLERVLEYLGLGMHKNQIVNISIDGQGEEGQEGLGGGVKRVLIPNQARNAKHWYDLSKQ